MKNERLFWGALLAASIGFVSLSTYFFMAVIFPHHVDQMKHRAIETVNHLQLVMPYLDVVSRQDYLEKISTKTEALSYLLLMDVEGTALAHSNPERVGMRFDEPGLRQTIATGERIEQIYVRDAENPSSPYHGEKTIDIMEPYFLADGTVAGAVNVGVSLAAVERIKTNYLLFTGLVTFLWLLLVSCFAFFQFRSMVRQRMADAALQESERRLSHAITATSDTIWEYGLADRNLTYNARWHEMLGLDDNETKPIEYWKHACHVDDIDRVLAAIHSALAVHSKVNYEVEFRMRHADGHWQWMLGRGNIVETDESGRPLVLSGTIVDINERKKQEERLRESEARYRGIIDNMQDGYYRTDKEGRLIFISPSVPGILGFERPEEVLGRFNESFWVHPEERETMLDQINRNGKVSDYAVQLRRKDGTPIHVATSSAYYHDQNGEIAGIEGVIRDISERISMQEQLLHAQKMEAVGRLAGGVAHDFNNMLSVIIGRVELALIRLEPDDPLKNHLLEIRTAADHSANLTRHLLAFARKQEIKPKVVELNHTVSSMITVCQRLIREEIEMDWRPAAAELHIKIDPNQLDQIVTNLSVNARDAITGTGKITITAGRTELSSQFCTLHDGLTPGDYATLTVSDTGCGMDKSVLDHIFEPFFTTKQLGQGTGLGLATVFGIVQQNNGLIEAKSTPGKGSTFTLYFPLITATVDTDQEESRNDLPHGQGETILLVEDNEAIIDMVSVMLEELNYHVLAANTPGAALEIAARHPQPVDLLLTDVVMPHMNGHELASRFQKLRPHSKCLFMSGYTADFICQHGILDKHVHLINKPLTMHDLANNIHNLLHSAEKDEN